MCKLQFQAKEAYLATLSTVLARSRASACQWVLTDREVNFLALFTSRGRLEQTSRPWNAPKALVFVATITLVGGNRLGNLAVDVGRSSDATRSGEVPWTRPVSYTFIVVALQAEWQTAPRAVGMGCACDKTIRACHRWAECGRSSVRNVPLKHLKNFPGELRIFARHPLNLVKSRSGMQVSNNGCSGRHETHSVSS